MAQQQNPLNTFSLKLYNKMSAGKDANFFISPFSISSALAMCHAGAKAETAAQLKSLLNVNHLSDQQILDLNHSYVETINKSLGKNVKISTANKIYPHKKFQIHKNFVDALNKHFHSEVETVDYGNSAQAASTINKWVEDKTNNKIKNLIDQSALNDLTRLVLVNAIYFKGDWLKKFRVEATAKENFHLTNGTVVKVDMMKLNKEKFKYLYRPGAIMANTVELPYIGETIAMTIILPHEKYSLSSVETALNDDIIQEILTSNEPKQSVRLELPKFKLEHKEELSDHMKSLGATHPFDEVNANFGGITNEPTGLYISKVIHQAVVEVNEEGTEAAAATAAVMMTRCAIHIDEPFDFICNRPFIFIIHDTVKHNILFYGKYAKPE